ncbi:peptidase M50 [Mycolicibacterium arenosum]|uniref:peptidase M50 n=1 Tax=Mycolicibacterium arenosum TaxID=2952157 RepID=UPI0038CD1740
MTTSVLRFGGRRIPRSLTALPELSIDRVGDVDAGRLVVVGTDADLGTVLSRLLKLDRLDVEVAFVPRWRTAATRACGLRFGGGAARAALTGAAQPMPLIRDESGNVLVGAALWVGESGPLHGEAIADDTVLFDGVAPGVRIEPTRDAPGLRASVVSRRMRPRGWVSGRAAQLGTTGASVTRDGEPSTRVVRRFAYYRHVTDWQAVC